VKPNLVASLRSSYPNWQFLRAMGLEVPEAMREAIASHDRARITAMASQLPDSFVDKLALAGTPQHVRDQVRHIAGLGIRELLIYPIPLPGQAVEEQITAFRGLVEAS
jgi:alkanesulfonate monooxygenase SsuD/methylene tetrahydromethanopterin reductase-like flavin-dependent oxidoreductase (luciferase family)